MPEIARAELKHRDSQLVIEHWETLSAGRSLPRRSDFDPIRIPRLLPNLLLVERCEEDFRFRLVGTRVVSHYGHDMTGRRFREVFDGEALEYWTNLYERVFRGVGYLIGRDSMFWQDRRHREFEWILMPLADAGDNVYQCLSSVVFDNNRCAPRNWGLLQLTNAEFGVPPAA